MENANSDNKEPLLFENGNKYLDEIAQYELKRKKEVSRLALLIPIPLILMFLLWWKIDDSKIINIGILKDTLKVSNNFSYNKNIISTKKIVDSLKFEFNSLSKKVAINSRQLEINKSVRAFDPFRELLNNLTTQRAISKSSRAEIEMKIARERARERARAESAQSSAAAPPREYQQKYIEDISPNTIDSIFLSNKRINPTFRIDSFISSMKTRDYEYMVERADLLFLLDEVKELKLAIEELKKEIKSQKENPDNTITFTIQLREKHTLQISDLTLSIGKQKGNDNVIDNFQIKDRNKEFVAKPQSVTLEAPISFNHNNNIYTIIPIAIENRPLANNVISLYVNRRKVLTSKTN